MKFALNKQTAKFASTEYDLGLRIPFRSFAKPNPFRQFSFPKIVENKTMKRESKAYSFQDQLMEIELRKELEEKKKKKGAGGAKGPGGDVKASRMPTNLTKKQQEIVDQELQKEKDIRSQIQEASMVFLSKYK